MLKKSDTYHKVKSIIHLLDHSIKLAHTKTDELEEYYIQDIKSKRLHLNIFNEQKNHFEQQLEKNLRLEQLYRLQEDAQDYLNKMELWNV